MICRAKKSEAPVGENRGFYRNWRPVVGARANGRARGRQTLLASERLRLAIHSRHSYPLAAIRVPQPARFAAPMSIQLTGRFRKHVAVQKDGVKILAPPRRAIGFPQLWMVPGCSAAARNDPDFRALVYMASTQPDATSLYSFIPVKPLRWLARPAGVEPTTS